MKIPGKDDEFSGDFYKVEGYGYLPGPGHGVVTSEPKTLLSFNSARAPLYIVVDDEIERATKKFGPFHSAMEGQAIVAEEFDEFTHAVRHETKERAREEAVQLAAMAIRFLMDVK